VPKPSAMLGLSHGQYWAKAIGEAGVRQLNLPIKMPVKFIVVLRIRLRDELYPNESALLGRKLRP